MNDETDRLGCLPKNLRKIPKINVRQPNLLGKDIFAEVSGIGVGAFFCKG